MGRVVKKLEGMRGARLVGAVAAEGAAWPSFDTRPRRSDRCSAPALCEVSWVRRQAPASWSASACLEQAHHMTGCSSSSMRCAPSSATQLPAASVLAGSAQHLALAGASIDAITISSAFHSFDESTAPAEVDQVVRPAALLGTLGDRFDLFLAIGHFIVFDDLLRPPTIELGAAVRRRWSLLSERFGRSRTASSARATHRPRGSAGAGELA